MPLLDGRQIRFGLGPNKLSPAAAGPTLQVDIQRFSRLEVSLIRLAPRGRACQHLAHNLPISRLEVPLVRGDRGGDLKLHAQDDVACARAEGGKR